MKPAPFRYAAPDSLDEALELLDRYGGDAKVMAGGQSLMPMMNLRLARPEVVIDLNRIPGLDRWERRDGVLAIGTLTRQRRLEAADGPAATEPLLGAAVRHIGHVATRSRGTIGGSLTHADPAAELPTAMLALDATLVARSAKSERTIGAAEFFTGIFTTALAADEILCEIRLPCRAIGQGASFVEIGRRPGDFAMVGVACTLAAGAGGTIAEARLALAGVGSTPMRMAEAEAALLGATPGAPAWTAAGAIVARSISPSSDLHATAAYRRSVAAVLTERALAKAWGRTRTGAS
jgi:carbon-monoxide dehydrogenase medium subunit